MGGAQTRIGPSPYDTIAELYDPWSRSVKEDVGFYVKEARDVEWTGRRARDRHGPDRDSGRLGRDPR